jgi:hypothetical protein
MTINELNNFSTLNDLNQLSGTKNSFSQKIYGFGGFPGSYTGDAAENNLRNVTPCTVSASWLGTYIISCDVPWLY